MGNKRRNLKSGPSALKTEPLPIAPVQQSQTLRMVISNPNALQQELNLLNLESAYLPTSKLPLLTVDSSKTNCSKFKSPADLQLTSDSKSSFIHLLPLSRNYGKSGEKTFQNYLYIPKVNFPLPVNPQKSQFASEKPDTKAEIALEAKLEATVLQQINKLAKHGLWSAFRLPKVMEPRRSISHYDCFLDEARWMAIDFREERKWKIEAAKRVSVMSSLFDVFRHFHITTMFCSLPKQRKCFAC